MMYYYVYELEDQFGYVRLGRYDHIEDAELFASQHPELPVPGSVISFNEFYDLAMSGSVVL